MKATILGVEVTLPEPMKKIEAATLTGTEKQIEFAKKIRKEIYFDLKAWITSKPRPLGAEYINALASQEAMKDYIEQNKFIASLSEKMKAIKVVEYVQDFTEVTARFERYAEVMAHSEAKYWIVNATNQAENYMNKKLRAYVIGE